MPKRTPRAKAEITGATLKHPERYRDRRTLKKPNPVGEPYPGMTEAERRFWAELAGSLPWLHAAHRTLLRLACKLAARMDSGEPLGVNASQALSSILSKLGATPVDESRCVIPEDDADPADRFFSGRPN